MGQLIAVHAIRGFKAHGLVRCFQFVYRTLFGIFLMAHHRRFRSLHSAANLKVRFCHT